ncbi:hypothetical protein LUZ61_018847 [Rhynchospora tenuis]|uniref:DNA2/NAM7 helicase helicase domain-containing protein n=1 Tax=Rhynchospora tenuis TaxID=198213 RepID=A0AAD5ZA49_9POAL|nr:hypothetical protein LUZ61_018847 [Rhynchospora tenuis]
MDEIVLSWKIEDICDQNLYKHKVKKIPSEFLSVNEYLESYTLPLIEETRAELFSCLEAISKAPYVKIQRIALCNNTKFGLFCNMNILADGFVGGTEVYEPKNGDAFILSSLKPDSTEDLLEYGVTYCLAIVKKVLEFELDEVMVKQFTMSVSLTDSSAIKRCTCALYLTSIVTNSRIWKALQYSGADQNFTLLKKFLSRNQMEYSISDKGQEHDNPEITKLLEQLQSIDINQSQLEAAKSTLSAVRCNNSSSVKLVWGPPGSGKTKTIGLILWFLKQLQIRTITCAPTNFAVGGVCSRLLNLLKSFNWHNGNSDGYPLCLADVVLFGSRGRMDIVGDLRGVFLDSRICLLENCFSSLNGWSCAVNSMIGLLEDCVLLYDVFVESSTEYNKVTLGFGDFLRKQFMELKENLNGFFTTLFIHLP